MVPVVIDSDGGTDDAFGIFLFLWNEDNSAATNFDSGITPEMRYDVNLREGIFHLIHNENYKLRGGLVYFIYI